MLKLTLFTIFSAIFCAETCYGLDIKKCKEEDIKCVTANSQALYDLTIKGDPNLEIEPADPIYHNSIDGNLSIIKYTLTNTSITGYKKCKLNYAQLSLAKSFLEFNLLCPEIQVHGLYEIDGRLIVLPVQGKGDFKLDARQYNITIHAEIKTVNGNDGKSYLAVKNFNINADIIDGIDFDLTNLFNGQKELAEPVLQFARENWKEVAKELQGPILNIAIKRLIKNLNKLLKTVPVDQMLISN